MRTLLLVMVASLAGACVMEEPADDLAGDTSTEDFELEDPEVFAEPDVSPAARVVPECQQRYSKCMDSKLGDKYDTPDHTRCYYCRSRCEDEGCWPAKTYDGKDCDYTKDKYRKKKQEHRP